MNTKLMLYFHVKEGESGMFYRLDVFYEKRRNEPTVLQRSRHLYKKVKEQETHAEKKREGINVTQDKIKSLRKANKAEGYKLGKGRKKEHQ